METIKSRTSFLEYDYARQGQHLITVIQTHGYQKVIIGRIYREYDKEKKRYSYKAADFQGNQMFFNVDNLEELKKQFKENGRFLANTVIEFKKTGREEGIKNITAPTSSIKNEITTIRSMKLEKTPTKAKENGQNKLSDKAKLVQMEKEQDEKNHTQHKDNSPENDKENQGLKETTLEDSMQINDVELPDEQSFNDETTEREAELENIRNDSEERDNDLEIEM